MNLVPGENFWVFEDRSMHSSCPNVGVYVNLAWAFVWMFRNCSHIENWLVTRKKLKTKETIDDLDNSAASLKYFLILKNFQFYYGRKQHSLASKWFIYSEMFCFSYLYLSYSGYKQSQTSHMKKMVLLTSLILSQWF